ncbi:MAG: DNA mismatch repair protein MutS [Armatimonadota bacterium]|nr:DNA mismatch repair protein MutS [Armatimonadota bacterium]MDR7609615.1 DNA mismatch repair protein MutS [Armatimonadota bacterium]
MMRQYQALKRAYPGTLLLFRLGDFYELFGEDAEVAARVLDLTLTSRPVAKGRRVPMCGVPHQTLESYLSRLLERGFRVAICEQVEDPRKAKGLVRREVVRVVTPGTVTSEALLPPRENVYLAAVNPTAQRWGVAVADLSTGEFRITELEPEAAVQELERLSVREVLHPEGSELPPTVGGARTPYEPWRFDLQEARRVLCEQFQVVSLDGFGCGDLPLATGAAGALIQYLRETQRSGLLHIHGLQVYRPQETLLLDPSAVRSLELLQPLAGKDRRATLVGVLDRTRTSMGGRLLRRWILAPLLDRARIEARLDAVEELVRYTHRPQLQERLGQVADLERLVGRCGHGSANPRDLVALQRSLAAVAELHRQASGFRSALLQEVASRLDSHDDLREELQRALVDDPPSNPREGGFVREGYDAELDQLRRAASDAKRWIRDLEARERERTGIKSLRVGFNKVFGYYIEVTRPHRDRVPPDYERRQTLVGAERYVTPEMKEREALILNAEERQREREYEIFCSLRDRVAARGASLLATASAVATLDVLCSFAEVSEAYGYARPELVDEPVLEVEGGRHPVVERLLEEPFVPNDLRMDPRRRIAVVTGPNFAGKSTYLRQNALLVILAQAGCFVPARSARVGLVDRVFTRVGAADDLAGGRSTFLVEMQEVANILRNATPRSLVILDEVGRGTATYDGLSIAWAVVEYLQAHARPRTLFATHYHELTELAGRLDGVFNLNVRVREEGERVVFLHQVAEGASDRAYGIHVARLAGVPREVTRRAAELLEELQGLARKEGTLARRGRAVQMALPLSVPSEVEAELASLDLASMTPLEALNKLHELQQRVRERTRAEPSKVVRMRPAPGKR